MDAFLPYQPKCGGVYSFVCSRWLYCYAGFLWHHFPDRSPLRRVLLLFVETLYNIFLTKATAKLHFFGVSCLSAARLARKSVAVQPRHGGGSCGGRFGHLPRCRFRPACPALGTASHAAPSRASRKKRRRWQGVRRFRRQCVGKHRLSLSCFYSFRCCPFFVFFSRSGGRFVCRQHSDNSRRCKWKRRAKTGGH